MKILSLLKNDKGFSLLESVIGVGIMAGMGAAAFVLVSEFQKKQNREFNAAGLQGVRVEIEKMLSSEEAFAKMLKDGKENPASVNKASLGCLLSGADCRSTTGGPIRLMYDYNAAAPKPLTAAADPNAPTQGLTPAGAPCNTFDRVAGNDRCPYRYDVRWRPVCPADPTKSCSNPTIEMVATLDFRPPAVPTQISRAIPPVDRAKYRITYLRSEKNDSITDTCLSVDGVYSSGSGSCATNIANQCGPDQFVVGFEDNGRPRCGSVNNFQCPAGTVLVALTEDGNYSCAAGCIANTSYSNSWFNSPN